jgi:hypothetical protein
MTDYNAITTLNEIRAHSPCQGGWEKLLKYLGKTKADDEPLHLLTILESNGFDDATWCLRAASLDRLSRHFQAWCAEQVLHLFEAKHPNDARVRDRIAMLRNDDATPEDRAAAWEAARAAARATALDAALAAARATAGDAARAAAWATARVAAWAAAQDATWAATWAAARDHQEQQLRKMIGQPQ